MDYKEKVIALLDSKELSQEQKEKLESIFPELKESENIRIIKAIKYGLDHVFTNNTTVFEVTKEQCLAWLEKQGKNNMGISEATKQELKDNLNKALEKETPESYNEFLEKQGEQKYVPKFKVGDTIAKKHNSDINDFGSFAITDITGGKYWYNDRIICDITEQDEWELYEPVRQKSAWSEEDKMMLQYAIEHFERQKRNCIEGSGRKKAMQEFIDWLKSLEPQSQWKPSDEQMNALREAVIEMGKSVSRCSIEEFHEIESLYNDLKKLKG